MCYKAGSRARFHRGETQTLSPLTPTYQPPASRMDPCCSTSGQRDSDCYDYRAKTFPAWVPKFNCLTPSLGIWMSCQCFKGAGRPASPTCFCQTCQEEHLPLINSKSCRYAGPLKAIPLTSAPKYKSRCLPLGGQLLKCWKRKEVVLLNK